MRPPTKHPVFFRRAGILLGLLTLATLTPWWVAFPATLLTLFFFNAYEIILIGLYIDALYGGGAALFGFSYPFTVMAALCAMLAPHLKRGIIFYS